jgi:hypothetical protein
MIGALLARRLCLPELQEDEIDFAAAQRQCGPVLDLAGKIVHVRKLGCGFLYFI